MKLFAFLFVNFALLTSTAAVAADDEIEEPLITKPAQEATSQSGAAPVNANLQHPNSSVLSKTDYEAAIEQRKIGTSIMATGILSLSGTGILLGILAWIPPDGSEYNCSNGDDCDVVEGNNPKIVGLAIASCVTLGLGLGLTIVGAKKRRSAGRIMRQFESQQKDASSLAPAISPLFNLSPNHQSVGLRLSF